jgi:hypothetical protein
LRLLVFTQCDYGERILDNIRLRAPREWEIDGRRLPRNLPPIVEEPEKLMETISLDGEWDLVLYLGEYPSVFSLLPAVIRRIKAHAVICPIDDPSWLPKGLENQIKSELDEMGVTSFYPRPFCSLLPVGVRPIDEFTRFFGAPLLEIRVSEGVVDEVVVIRGAPCGSTWLMAEKLRGIGANEASKKASILVQIYPCLASRRLDRILGDAPIHVAGRLAEVSVAKALKI